MRIYSFRSSPLPTKSSTSKGLLIAVVVLIVIIPVLFVAGVYYISQPFTKSNVPTVTSSPSTPFSPSPGQPNVSPPSISPSPPTASIPKYTLSEAIAAGYVQANITGVSGTNLLIPSFSSSGASSGDVIILHIKRLVDYTIEITPFPTGTLLVPDSTSTQTMAILKLKGIDVGSGYYKPRTQIILDTSNSVDYLFSAYCVEFTKDNPDTSTMFTQGGMANSDVIKIFNAIDQLPSNVTTITAIQTAVFVVTNNVSASELSSRFTSSSTEIQNAKTILQAAGIDTTTKQLFK